MSTNTSSTSISEISVSGKAFVDATGNRFMVRGIALSTSMAMNGTNDLLADTNYDYIKNIILPHLTYLGVNTVRVYQVDHTLNHNKVMNLLSDSNIYVMVGLVTLSISVDRINPKYTLDLYNRITSVAQEFCAFSNTFAFSVGNEVVFPGEIYTAMGNNAKAANDTIKKDAAVIKSMIRDLKGYMNTKSLRAVPVGVAMQDGPASTLKAWGGIGTDVVAQYYAAGNSAERADYIGINTYRYVNPSTGHGPLNAYDGLASEVTSLPIPVFLTESGGLNIPADSQAPDSTRDWAIVTQVFNNPTLYQQLSGQVAFEFFEKEGFHGLFAQNADPSKTLIEFTYGQYNGGYKQLAAQFQTASRISVPAAGTTPSPSTAPAKCNPPLLPCPAPNIKLSIENYAPKVLKVVQNTVVIGTLPEGSANSPSTTPITASNDWPLLIQDEVSPSNWEPVCQVSADKLKDGKVIKNNVSWGSGVACPIN
ncbi:Glucanosyltransferase [Reichenbachiella faecimaris]|uniref:Glucanosyltransferase n=1 Tax=Reichenbachiella faecimaris TaxID=692418 RepID=A0A1W2G9L4_REIFA|nr:hypothetical protein [Reichenbachiella faecimaris]SMD33162.1 Glucanosyltransferase [Reichenbachiella faecimaris]